MRRPRRPVLTFALAAAVSTALSCGGGSKSPTAVSTPPPAGATRTVLISGASFQLSPGTATYKNIDIPPEGMLDATVDWDFFSRTRSELGAAFVRVLGYFREDGEKAVGRIEEAMQRRDTAALVIPADMLKTEARHFGAEMLGDLAETIENTARSAVEMRTFPDNLIPEVTKLRPLYLKTIEQLDRAQAAPK